MISQFLINDNPASLDKYLEKLYDCQSQKPFNLFKILKLEGKYLLNYLDTNKKNISIHWFKVLDTVSIENFDFNKFIKELQKGEESIFLKMVEIYSFARIQNFSKVRTSIEQLTKADPKKMILEFNGLYLSDDQRKQAIVKIEMILDTVKKLIPKELFETLALSISHNWPENLKRAFEKKYLIDFSKVELREKINSPNYGISAPGAWLPILLKRGSQIEIIDYLKLVIEHFSYYSFEDCLWIFEFYLPPEPLYREKIKTEIIKLSKKNDLYSYELINILLKSQGIQSLFNKKELSSINVNFQKRRNNYLKFIHNPHYANFSIFNLILLGDQDISYASKLERK